MTASGHLVWDKAAYQCGLCPGLNGSSAAADEECKSERDRWRLHSNGCADRQNHVATAGFSAPRAAVTTTPATLAAKTGHITVTNTCDGRMLVRHPDRTRQSRGPEQNHGNFTIAAGGTCVTGVVVAPEALAQSL